MYPGKITDIEGLKLKHLQDEQARTGVSVLLCPDGAVAGVDVRGAAPGTRETDLLRSENMIQKIHGVVLTGGSAFGLAASDGVMRALEEKGIGFDTHVARVPIVCSAVLFDLGIGSSSVRPDARMGYRAAKLALEGPSDETQGPVGAGCGATVGKMIPGAVPQRSGIGMASMQLPHGGTVAAMVAVNAAGDVVHPLTGDVLGCGTVDGKRVTALPQILGEGASASREGSNTTIGVVATDVALTKPEANRLATAAHDGYALAIRPVHTMHDGDTIFALSAGEKKENIVVLQAAAVEVVWRAIVNAVTASGKEDAPGMRKERRTEILSAQTMRALLPVRRREAHKGEAGHALLIAGKRGMAGAALLCVKGALRGGAGLVTAAVPADSVGPVLQNSAPSAMVLPLRETGTGEMEGSKELYAFLTKASAVGIGCGMGTGNGASAILEMVLNRKIPTVLDADALNLVAASEELRKLLHGKCVLTPHPGEMARLLGRPVKDRIQDALLLSRECGVTVLLKGADTIIASPDGTWKQNPTGSPAMATGGSGDVLTGIITALLCQGLAPFEAACLGAYWHGLAGEKAQEKEGLLSVTSMDIADSLGAAWKQLSNG
ncbi:MAG: NAD(P)H-hydrate dehydratase [Clostridia bacterium]|nr:NAD(P)H-hydrate dehydratase [Clostridia bacterium]